TIVVIPPAAHGPALHPYAGMIAPQSHLLDPAAGSGRIRIMIEPATAAARGVAAEAFIPGAAGRADSIARRRGRRLFGLARRAFRQRRALSRALVEELRGAAFFRIPAINPRIGVTIPAARAEQQREEENRRKKRRKKVYLHRNSRLYARRRGRK